MASIGEVLKEIGEGEFILTVRDGCEVAEVKSWRKPLLKSPNKEFLDSARERAIIWPMTSMPNYRFVLVGRRMRNLIDTQIFIWLSQDSDRLSRSATALLADPSIDFFLSMASVWEMQIKFDIKKLALPLPLSDLIVLQQKPNNIRLLSIEPRHIYALSILPMHHKDPFDRLLIAQSIAEKCQFYRRTRFFDLYDAQILR